jgi:ABC-2 type transport system permease protein
MTQQHVMSTMWRRAKGLLRSQYAYMVEYRAELVLWALSMSLSFILMGIWYEASARADVGMSQGDVVRYFFCVFIVRQLTVTWVLWDFEQQIQQGQLSSQLLLPIDPVWKHLAGHVAERLARGPFVIALAVLFFALYPAAFFVPSPTQLLQFVVLAAGAFLLRFAIQYTVAMACFWLERASAIETLHMLLYMFVSGAVAPLEAFPPGLRDVVMWTPFPYLIWLPARAVMGGLEDAELYRGVLVMTGWFVFFVVLNRVLWHRGLRRYSSMGA